MFHAYVGMADLAGQFIVNNVLKPYLKNVGKEQLKFGTSKGKLKLNLKDIQIREDALQALDLPVEIRLGIVGRLQIVLDLHSASIQINDVFAVVQYVISVGSVRGRSVVYIYTRSCLAPRPHSYPIRARNRT